MRAVLNISLPEKMAMKIKKEVRTGKYATVSEFFRDLLRNWEESKLLAELQESRREIRAGKGKVLKSLKDLR
ncbi:MAG: ribbon-helix-helix domain-containing protein [Candidatus Falkowbacteria bacterium]